MQVVKAYKVGIIDENLVSRTGLGIIVGGFDDFELVFSSPMKEQLIPYLWRLDLVVCTFSAYNEKIIKILASFHANSNAKPIIVNCPNLTTSEQLKLVHHGAKGIISDWVDETALANILRCIAYGGTHFPPMIQNELANVSCRPLSTSLVRTAFSELKVRILILLAEGCTSKEIAKRLNRTRDTIEWHKRDMRKMAKVRSIHKLLLFAQDYGLIDSTTPNKVVKKISKSQVGFGGLTLS